MWLIIGLGNPGSQYARNRHNVGFRLAEALADANGFQPERQKYQGLLREGKIGSQKCLILRPQTFYNDSGKSVGAAQKFFKIPVENVIVLHDELDLAPGKVRVKIGGSAAGNNGLRSIMGQIGDGFTRVRIGIGHPGHKSAVTGHVLGNFTQDDLTDWVEDLDRAFVAGFAHLFADDKDGNAKFMSTIAQALVPQRAGPTTAPGNLPPPKLAKKSPTKPDKAEPIADKAEANPDTATQHKKSDKKSGNAFTEALRGLLNKKD